MDDRKKEAIYELGCCFEAMGSPEKAIDEYKLVYSADISFRGRSPKKSTPSTNKILDRNGGWRRGRDSNPGTFRHTRFRVGHIRPLCHLSRLGYCCQPIHVLANLGIIEKKENWRSFLLSAFGQNSRSKAVFGFYNMISGTRIMKMKLFFLYALARSRTFGNSGSGARRTRSQSPGHLGGKLFRLPWPGQGATKGKTSSDVGREPSGTWAVTGR